MKKLIIFLIIVYTNSIMCNDLKSLLNVKYSNDSLIYEILIINTSENDIVILLDNWAIDGNEKNNFFISFPRKGCLVNSFWYYPKKFGGIVFRTERDNYPEYNNIPNFKVIKRKNSLVLTVVFKEKIIDPLMLTYTCYLPYFNDDILSEFSKDEMKTEGCDSVLINLYNIDLKNKHHINYYSSNTSNDSIKLRLLNKRVQGFIKSECVIEISK